MINPITEDRFFVITGGPGSGKTTLIEALASQGLARSIEAGREMQSYHWARSITGPVIFDRGIPDVIGYLTLVKLPVPEHMERAAREFRYHGNVFLAPPWPEIFGQDTERKQTFEEARATYDVMVETYATYGYNLIMLPLVSVEERMRFVMDNLKASFLEFF